MEFLSFLAENIPVIWKNNKKEFFIPKIIKLEMGILLHPQSFSL